MCFDSNDKLFSPGECLRSKASQSPQGECREKLLLGTFILILFLILFFAFLQYLFLFGSDGLGCRAVPLTVAVFLVKNADQSFVALEDTSLPQANLSEENDELVQVVAHLFEWDFRASRWHHKVGEKGVPDGLSKSHYDFID